MDKILEQFKWKSFFVKERFEVLTGPLLWYSKYLCRAIYITALLYTAVFLTKDSIDCYQSHSTFDDSNFVDKMCILPYFGVHSIHSNGELPGPLNEQQQNKQKNIPNVKYDYYLWSYAIVVIMSFIAYFPLSLFRYTQASMIRKLETVLDIINFFPLENVEKIKSNKIDYFLNDSESTEDVQDVEDTAELELQFRKAISLQKLFLDQIGAKRFIFHYFLVQLFALGTILFQLALLNWIFHGLYFEYFIDWVKYFLGYIHEYPTDNIFQLIVTCHFRTIGLSGNYQSIDAVCVLPYNLVNKYIFFSIGLLYGLLVVLFVVHVLAKLNRINTCFYRNTLLERTGQISAVLGLIPEKANINLLYGDAALMDMYYWTFVMLEFTSVDMELLMMKFDDLKVVLRKAAAIDLLNKMERISLSE